MRFFMFCVQIVIPLIKNMSSRNNSILSLFCTLSVRVVMHSRKNKNTATCQSQSFSHVLCDHFCSVFQFTVGHFIVSLADIIAHSNRLFTKYTDQICPFELGLQIRKKKTRWERETHLHYFRLKRITNANFSVFATKNIKPHKDVNKRALIQQEWPFFKSLSMIFVILSIRMVSFIT